MFVDIQGLLKNAAQKKGFLISFSAISICHEVQKIINEVWDINLQTPCAKSFKSGKVHIGCASSSSMYEMQMRKSLILEQIKSSILGNKVSDICFTLDS